MSNSLWPRGLQHTKLPCPLLSSGVCSNSCPLGRWYYPTIFNLCRPLLLLPSGFPIIWVFSNELTLRITWPKYWSFASALVLPMNIQGWLPLGLTGLISLLFKGLSRVFCSTSSSVLSLFYCPAFTSIHDYWKNHSFDYMDLCRQSNVSAFLIHCLGLS